MSEGWQKLAALRMICLSGLQMKDLSIAADFANAIRTTSKGDEVLSLLQEPLADLKEHELRFVIFLLLGPKGDLIDHDSTNLNAIETFVADAVSTRAILLPYIYQRLLYDNVFNNFDQPDNLGAPDVITLFEGVPQGIFQYGCYVAGPLGLLESKQNRLIYSRNRMPLWHCNNVSCGTFHQSNLIGPNIQLSRWHSRASHALAKCFEPMPNSDDFEEALVKRKVQYDDYWPSDLHGLLGNGFSGNEIVLISQRLHDRFGKSFKKYAINRQLLNNASSELTTNTTESAAIALQLCMLAADDEIIACVDELVLDRTINIPESEIRTSMTGAPYSWQRVRCQCSNLGVRVVGRHSEMTPLARLRRLVMELYGENQTEDLLWKLRKHPGSSVGEKLERFIDAEDPVVVLHHFMFASPATLKASLAQMRIQHLRIPENDTEEKKLLEIVCWKLGFPRKRFASSVGTFRTRLTLFKKGSSGEFPTDEEWREQVRSSGVNLFVSLEEVLESALAFTVWLLFSDHLSEKHLFNLRKAKSVVEKEISGILSTDKGPIEFKASGKNTLFPLIMGFSALAKRVEQLLSDDIEKFKKPVSHLPFWTTKSTLQIFPFRHKYFLLDMEKNDCTRLIALIQKITSRLANGAVLNVRNNVPHLSALFPDRDQIRDCCQTLEEVIDEMEAFGLLPVLFAAESVETDSWQHRRVRSVDYRGRVIDWTVSAAATCLHGLPGLTDPQIIVPGVRLPGTAEPIRVGIQEDSSFSRLWDDYPKRKISEGLTQVAE